MEKTTYTFWEVITDESKIEIPIIQRDYAQGRLTEKAKTIREGILESLYEVIDKNNDTLDFDFIYGNLIKGTFVPLDGQQRLTTLYLLHWYLALKDGEFDRVKNQLSKFTYETRFSSRDFCLALSENEIKIPDQKISLSAIIEDQPWFFLSWKKDPTIQSMLVMIDDIHKMFYHTTGFFKRLTEQENPLVNFQFIKIETYGLSDNLYIKMNARGKELTEFENFKAKFEQYLEKNHPSRKQEFADKIDGSWTDFFWLYKQDHLVDAPFIKFFQFISEMLYYQNIGYNSEDITELDNMQMKIIEKIYSVPQNLDFLFTSLDLLTEIKEIPTFFESIFSQNEYEAGKVALFDTNVDLFNKCTNNTGFDAKEKMLFYFILQYLIQKKESVVSDDLIERTRVARNLILRVRQRKQTEFIPDLRYADLPMRINDLNNLLDLNKDVYQLLNSGIDMVMFVDSLKSEIEKAKLIIADPLIKTKIHELEDHSYFKGSLHNLNLEVNKDHISGFVTSIYQIWPNLNNTLTVQAMLTMGDYSINIGHSALGERYFFGNDHKWHTILTITGSNADKINRVLPLFLKKYESILGDNPESKLHNMVKDYLNLNPLKDWRYYFIKYPQMLSSNNLYAWVNDYELRSLNKNSLLGYHTNPYIRSVGALINNKAIIDLDKCYSQYDEKCPLILSNNMGLYAIEDGWRIKLPEGYLLKNEMISNFKLQVITEGKDYLLKHDFASDRIETAIEFVNTMLEN